MRASRLWIWGVALTLAWALAACGSSGGGETTPDGDSDRESVADGDSAEADTPLPADGDGESASEGERETTPEGDSDSAAPDGDSDSDAESEIDPDDVGHPTYETDPQKLTLHGACPAETRLGGFKVEMNDSERKSGYTAIDGQVNNAITPSLVPDVFQTSGDCKLLKRHRLVCDPSCGSSQTCGFEQTCIDAPTGQDMGMAVFRGLVKPVALMPIQPGNKYFYTKLAHPGFAADTVLQLATSGGFLPALELYGVGVAKLVPSEQKWVLAENQPLALHWTAPAATARSRVYLEINVDQHGATPLTLVCDMPDTGLATVEATLVNAFLEAGVTGYPTGKVVRRTVDSFSNDKGCVDFQVTSVRPIAVEVTGHIPCTSDSDCPSPLTCDKTIQQCRSAKAARQP